MMSFGKLLIGFALAVAAVGVLLLVFDRLPLLGKLPGDFSWRRGNVRIFVPITTSLLLSAAASLVLWLVTFLTRK